MPGDKSVSHRALMLAAIARGTTVIWGLNGGDDVWCTRAAMQALGVPIEDCCEELKLTGISQLAQPSFIDCGNSATTMRLLMGLLAGRVSTVLDGDESLRLRPMERVAQPLRAMGAGIETSAAGTAPVKLRASRLPLRGIDFAMPVASAQLKSALLLAGQRAKGPTRIFASLSGRDHSERMLRRMGAEVSVQRGSITIQPGALRSAGRLRIPGDFSAAAFFIAGAAVRPGNRLSLLDVGINPTRTAALQVMRDMGADVSLSNERDWDGEPVADINVRGGAPLRGVDIDPQIVPNLIDEIPALCALAAAAEGTLTVRGAAELRAKESDRIAALTRLLRAFGAHAEDIGDGIAVRGGSLRASTPLAGITDHRIVMSAAVLAAAAGAPAQVPSAACVATSFPGFEAAWKRAFC